MKVSDLTQIQQLVLDIQSIKRNHNIPGGDERENVVEHCFSVAMLCWRLYVELKPDLDFNKVLKYCLAHDFLERGLKFDVNTYATTTEREDKKKREELELLKLEEEFKDFPEMLETIKDYETSVDEEAKFVWSVDKMQAIILGDIDNWRPYERIGITYEQFCNKGDEFLAKCPECLKGTFEELVTYSRGTFYDQPPV